MLMKEYARKVISAENAAALVKSGDWVEYGMGLCQPIAFDAALAMRKDELRNVGIRGLMSVRPLAVVERVADRSSLAYSSWHFSSQERRWAEEGRCDYIPMSYRYQPEIYRKALDVDVAVINTPPMDKHGYFNFSLTNSSTMAFLEKARIVIMEVNEALPRTCGGFEECIHLRDVDYVIEGGNHPLVALPVAEPSDVDLRIAEHIVKQMKDGSVVQLGIGGVPNSVGTLIAQSELRDLGMHTEMLVDAYLAMHKSGKLTNARKKADRHKGVWTFCLGSLELYEWVADNPGLASCPVNYTNSPEIMGRNDNLVTINGCIEADFHGQVSSESSSIRQISGTGGQLDFVNGSFVSDGGKSFICMASTYKDKESGRIRSRIVPTLPQGEVVTAPRSQVHQLVTEWGSAVLVGCSKKERCERIISLAHPDFRDGLFREAESLGLLRRSQGKEEA
ncbi:MAG: butyryl-CoA:acetate CoA-transferase [Deltaproteobacteria bacterium]|nr:butyryl-CoA:acetate CoA-transferase [Deltaproteobacteria bacterium]